MSGLLLFRNKKWNNSIKSIKTKRRRRKGLNQRRQRKKIRTQPMRRMILLFSDKMMHFMINLQHSYEIPSFFVIVY